MSIFLIFLWYLTSIHKQGSHWYKYLGHVFSMLDLLFANLLSLAYLQNILYYFSL